MTLAIGSLFSGIGGLELGLEWAGLGPVVWQVEQDAYCRAVLEKHWPDATRYEDVRHVGRSNLAPVDVICGGFPCQDISYAGLGAGLAGERSGLWFEFARIVRDMGPRYVVVENVAALLARGLGDVLGTLADLGYDAEWSCIQAADVGAPHLRDRVFVLAYANGRRGDHIPTPFGHGRALSGEGFQRIVRRGGRGQAALAHPACVAERESADEANAVATRRHPREELGRGGWWATEPRVGRVVDGIPPRLVEQPLHALGNAVVPQVAEVVGRLILAHAAASDETEAA